MAALEHAKASIREAVEHLFRLVKRQFGYVKARYRGLAKNGAQVLTLFALANLGAQAPAGHDRVGAPERCTAAVKRGGAMQNELLMAFKSGVSDCRQTLCFCRTGPQRADPAPEGTI